MRGALWDRGEFDALLTIETDLVAELTADPAYGPEHLETVRMRRERAVTLHRLGRKAEALPDFRFVATRYAAHPEVGPNAEDTLRAKGFLAHCLAGLGELAEALEIYTELEHDLADDPRFEADQAELLEISKNMRRSILSEQIQIALDEGEAALRAGAAEKALADFTRGRDIALAHPEMGPEDRNTALMRAKCGEALYLLGRQEEALAELDLASGLPLVPSPAEEFRLLLEEYRAQIRSAAGEDPEALAVYTGLVKILTEHDDYGPAHPRTGNALQKKALVLNRLERNHQAVVEHSRVVELFAGPVDGASSAALPKARYLLALSQLLAGRLGPAARETDRLLAEPALGEPEQADLLQRVTDLADQINSLTPSALEGLSRTAIAAHEEQRLEHALEAWTDVIDLAVRHPDIGASHPDTLTARANRASVLLALDQGDPAAAEPSRELSWLPADPRGEADGRLKLAFGRLLEEAPRHEQRGE